MTDADIEAGLVDTLEAAVADALQTTDTIAAVIVDRLRLADMSDDAIRTALVTTL